MSVQHESPPSTAHHSHHHSSRTFPATPVDIASPFSVDVTARTAESFDELDALSSPLNLDSSQSAPPSSMLSSAPRAVSFLQPVQTSSSAASTAPLTSYNAAPAAFPTTPTTSSASSPDFSTPEPSSSSSSSTSFSSSSFSSDLFAASSSTSSSPSVTAVERLRPSLQMYRNQVAGHSPLFWHSGTICKPLIPAEYTFYAQLEEQMPAFMPYVPKFYGLLDLEQLTEEMASSLLTETTGSSGNHQSASNSTDRQRSGSGDTGTDTESSEGQSTLAASSVADGQRKQSTGEDNVDSNPAKFPSLSPPPASSESSMTANSSAGRLYNKWAIKCQLRKPGNSKARIQYIVLEDLTYAYAKPCILDLKLGTRQHSDTEPPSKIASKTARCLHTTSHSLGLRLCGMQVYHPAADMYQFRDKYWGRGLDVAGFKRAMRDYFWDGERIVEEVVHAFVARMEKMRRAVMLWTKGRRFYSSSLLLVYEGDRNSRAGGSGQDASHAAMVASASGSGGLEKLSVLRQGSDSTLTSTGSGFFSPLLPSPVSSATSASPGSSHRSSSSHQLLATSASMVSLSKQDSSNASPHASSSLSSSSNNIAALSSSVPSLSTVPAARATMPASFSSATLSSTFRSAQTNSSSSSSIASTTAPTATAATTPHASSSSLHSAPIKLYSHKRKTTHAQAMALARQRGSIDVRIIDFAHTSVVGEAAVAGGVVEGGSADEVDSGLLFGFDCLLELLRGILEEKVLHGTEEEQQMNDRQRAALVETTGE